MKKISALLCILFLFGSACNKTSDPQGDANVGASNDTSTDPDGNDPNAPAGNGSNNPTDDPAGEPVDEPADAPADKPAGGDDTLKTVVVSFTTFGDWGEPEESILVANAIGKYCKTNTCEFNLDLGDSFNEGPPSSVDDPRWKTEYVDVFGNLNIPFYVALGNHDMDGDFTVLLDYANVDPAWIIPAEYYTFLKPAKDPFIQFFVLNSGDFEFENKERDWLASEYSKSTAKWKVLVTHVPVISNGLGHGDDDGGFNYRLIPAICNKFDLILSGHEHIFSHLSEEIDGCKIDQFIVSTGGMEHYDINYNDPRVHSTGAFFGFGRFEAKEDSIEFKMMNTDGDVFYQTTLVK